MECNTQVRLECTKDTFWEKGSGYMADLLISKSKVLLKQLLDV
jgi:hypothetical protein